MSKFTNKFSMLTTILLTSTIILSACNSNTSGTKATTAPSSPTEQVNEVKKTESAKKIVLFQSKVEIADQLEAMAEAYKKETGVEIEVWGTTGDDYFQQNKNKLASNQGPTVFSVQPGSEAIQMSSYLADLSDLTFVDKIAPGMVTEIDGKVVGIPYTFEGFGMVYNKSLMAPDKIKDYDTFETMMKEMKAQSINGFGLSQESYFLIGHILNTPFALQSDPTDFIKKLNAGEVKMADTPEFKEFAKFYAAIRDNSYNPLETNYDKECGDFAAGKTAAIHQGNWSYGMFKDFDTKFEFGLMPLPIAGNDKLAVSVPTAWCVNSQATPEEIQAGKDFLNWLYTSETGQSYLINEFGFIPILEGVEAKNLDPLSSDVARYAAEGKTIPWAMSQWPAGIVDVAFMPVAQEFFTTDMTQELFLQKLDEAWANVKK